MNKLKQLLPFFPEALRDCYLEYKYKKQFKNWKKTGCPIPTPHIIKQLAIKSYQEKSRINILVETGTYLGDMVYAQRKIFKKIYTIELSEQLHKMCVKRLKKYKHIELIQGDSGSVLGSICKELKEKAIFWLDGHYSGGITAKGETNCPIINELKTIFKTKLEHIILIDDARDFNGQNDYPTVEELVVLIKENGFANSYIKIENDIIRIELKS